jgi:hypothetical protein
MYRKGTCSDIAGNPSTIAGQNLDIGLLEVGLNVTVAK